MTQLLKASPATVDLYAALKERVLVFTKQVGRPPAFVVIQVGHHPASTIYVQKKFQMAANLGLVHHLCHFEETVAPEVVAEQVERFNHDPQVDGVFIQRPLPKGFLEAAVTSWIAEQKDVDGFHPVQLGKLYLGLPGLYPCTPLGIMALLRFYRISLEGKIACVVGRSAIVGKPLAGLLLRENATVLQCHQKTPSLFEWTARADLLVVAVGKPHLFKAEAVKPGAVVIDVGIQPDAQGKWVGDVDFEAVAPKSGAITPVPGGVGPMTVAFLMNNIVQAAEEQAAQRHSKASQSLVKL